MSNEKNERLNEKGQTLEEFLAGYDLKKYDRPSVTVDNVVIASVEGRPAVLLIKRRNHPFIGCWALPGGFLEMDESLEDGAVRELFEETGVTGVSPKQLGAYGDPGRDPRGRIITVAFLMELPEGAVPKAADDAADAGLFFIEADESRITLIHTVTGESVKVPYGFKDGRAEFIPAEDIACDHGRMLADALRKLGMI